MLLCSNSNYNATTKGVVDKQVGDPFKEWIDGEVLTENTFDEFHNFIFGYQVFENPDPLIKEKGFRILDKMLDQDPGIKNAYWSRIFTILSGGFSIDPADEGCERSEEIAEFVKWNVEVFLQTSITSFLRKMLDSSRQGFKIAELVWKVIEEGKYAGKIGLYDLIVRDSRNYSFLTDEKGRIDPMGVIEGISSTGYFTSQCQPRQLPANKFVIYSYLALNDDAASLYGNSDFRALWRAFYGDLTSHRLELRSAETFARPPVVGNVAHGEFTKPEQAKVQNDMAGVYNRTYTQIPDGVKVAEIGMKRSDSNAFQSLHDRHVGQVQNGMMMGTQGGNNDNESVKIKTQMLLTTLDAVSSDVADVIMERQIFRKLIDLNYKTQKYPFFRVPKLSINRKDNADFIKSLIETGVIAPDEPWIRGFVDVPKQDMATRDRQMSRKRSDINPSENADINKSGSGTPGIEKVEDEDKDDESGLSKLSKDDSVVILEATSIKDIREFDQTKKISLTKKLNEIVVIKERDTGEINIEWKVKDGVSVEDFEKHLEEAVDVNPQNKFFIAKIFGEHINDAGVTAKLMKVIRVVAADPNKDRVVVLG